MVLWLIVGIVAACLTAVLTAGAPFFRRSRPVFFGFGARVGEIDRRAHRAFLPTGSADYCLRTIVPKMLSLGHIGILATHPLLRSQNKTRLLRKGWGTLGCWAHHRTIAGRLHVSRRG